MFCKNLVEIQACQEWKQNLILKAEFVAFKIIFLLYTGRTERTMLLLKLFKCPKNKLVFFITKTQREHFYSKSFIPLKWNKHWYSKYCSSGIFLIAYTVKQSNTLTFSRLNLTLIQIAVFNYIISRKEKCLYYLHLNVPVSIIKQMPIHKMFE